VSSGGGGYGDPFQRPAGKVLNDVLDRYVSPQQARNLYGVVLREGEGTLSFDEAPSRTMAGERGAASVNLKA